MGYINGSDSLFALGGKCFGHCEEHTTNYETETKERSVKAPEVKGVDLSKFKETAVTALGVTVSFKGFQFDEESELTFEDLQAMWYAAEPIEGEMFHRPKTGVSDTTARSPYLKGQFIITKLSEGAPAGDDLTYDGELKLTGAPETWTPKLAE